MERVSLMLTCYLPLPLKWINYMSDELITLIGQITGITLALSLVIGVIVFYVIYIIYSFKLGNLRKEYINSLDEHDKSVILTYQALKVFRKRRR